MPREMNPTDFMMQMMEDLDNIEEIVIVRRYKDGSIDYGHSTGSRINMYAMLTAAQAFVQAGITVSEMPQIEG